MGAGVRQGLLCPCPGRCRPGGNTWVPGPTAVRHTCRFRCVSHRRSMRHASHAQHIGRHLGQLTQAVRQRPIEQHAVVQAGRGQFRMGQCRCSKLPLKMAQGAADSGARVSRGTRRRSNMAARPSRAATCTVRISAVCGSSAAPGRSRWALAA
jgi:hypothetical protein